MSHNPAHPSESDLVGPSCWLFKNVSEADTAALAQATAILSLAAMKAAVAAAADLAGPDADSRARRAVESGLRIYLHGGLGAGKTTWTRHFLAAYGVTGRIKSPSFSVLESYEVNAQHFHHLDFYRQTDPGQWQGGGLRELFLEPAVVLVEWPEQATGLPLPHIELWLDWAIEATAEEPRTIKIEFYDRHDGLINADLLRQWSTATETIAARSTLAAQPNNPSA
jgi:tRNA threonylcarbamoyladenosine biosynthesis protein TsaE